MPFLQWISELNLFETNATDDISIRIQRWSTRFYILIFAITLLILSIYASFYIMTVRIEIQNPTIDLYKELEDKYSMECYCSETSIFHDEFIDLVPIYHQVCSSDFVTQRWFDYLFDSRRSPFYRHADFRSTASQQFQLLAALCRLTAKGIDDGLRSFLRTELISDKVMSEAFFSATIQAHIDAFKINTLDALDYKLRFIRQLIYGNSLLTSTSTILSFAFNYFDMGDGYRLTIFKRLSAFILPNGSLCTCDVRFTCNAYAGFFGNNLFNSDNSFAYLYIIDGWYVGCRPIDSVLFSTLKTFYNQTMINSFLRFFTDEPSNFTCLNATKESRFYPNTTLETITKSGFIEKWIEQKNYSLYFNHCAPKLCSYTINNRFNIDYIITAIIGVYGGLSIGLCLIIPIIVKLIFQRNEETSPENHSFRRPKQLIAVWLQKLISALVKMNLFRSATHTEPSDIYQQRWTTRFYIIILSLSFIIVTMYTAMAEQIIHDDFINPSLDEVLDLQQQTSLSSLQCPCSQLSSSFEYYIELIPTYHEICFSDFVSEDWIEVLSMGQYMFPVTDFRQSAPTFRLLQSLCELANTTVNNALKLFYETKLINENLMTKNIFEPEMNSSGEYFKYITPDRFSYWLELMRQTIRVNQFIYSSDTNYAISMQNDTGHLLIYLDPIIFRDGPNGTKCSLLFEPICKIQTMLTLYNGGGMDKAISIPGFYVSSSFVDSLLLSQIQFLYNQSLIDSILTEVELLPSATALSETNRFPNNVTFDVLAKNLFIESWRQTLNYTAYFEQCQPHSCSYTTSKRPTFVSLITTVIGLSASISVVLRFLSPFIISFILKRCRQRQQRSSEVIQREGHFCLRTYIVAMWRKVREVVITLNMFGNVDKPNPPEEELRAQRKWTRIYIVALIVALTSIAFFTLITSQTNTIIVKKPTLNVYENLPKSTDCSCTNLSIPYKTFVDFNPLFHDVCTSQFIDPYGKWMRLLSDLYTNQTNYKRRLRTFQSMAMIHFQAIQVMCEILNKTINNELTLFLGSTLVSVEMIKSDRFQKKINATLSNLLHDIIPSNLLHSLQLIRSMYSGNGLISAFTTNWYPVISHEASEGNIYMQAREYNLSSCNCATSPTCMEPMSLELFSGQNWIVPGMMIGCLPLESMLQSTLECIYDQNCLNRINQTVSTESLLALSTSRTRFQPINTTKLESIVAELFIEDWGVKYPYEKYFNSCQPETCSYTLSTRFNIRDCMSTILTIYSGLCILLQLIIPIGFKLGQKFLRWRNRQIRPINIS